MNLLSVISKLDEQNMGHIKCWLLSLHFKKFPNRETRPPFNFKCDSPADVALLDKKELREGAKQWARDFELPSNLTHSRNVTAETARKIFGEGS